MRKFLEELKPKSFADWAILITAVVWFAHGVLKHVGS